VNPVLVKDFGVYKGRRCYEYFHDRTEVCPWCKNPDVFAGKTVRWEWFSSRNGKTYDLIDTPLKNPDGSISKLEIFRDITERKKAEALAREREAELAHVSRLGIMGEMASGIAHELNQPLFAILNYAEACKRTIQAKSGAPELILHDLEEIGAAARRASNTIQRIREFVSRREVHRSSIDLSEVLREAIHFIESEIRGNNISVRIKDEPDLPMLLADPILIQQVILNLLRNAIQAMDNSHDGPRVLTLRTSRVGDAEELTVSDTGSGMSAGMMDRLFEPFFTTKPKGLGLGLSLSRSVMESHGGSLTAELNPDRGMTFRLTLPVSEGDQNDGA